MRSSPRVCTLVLFIALRTRPWHVPRVHLLYIHVSWVPNYCFGNICSVREAFSCGNSPFLTKQWATKGLCRRAHTQAVYMISVVIVSVPEFLTTDIWLPHEYSVAVTALFLKYSFMHILCQLKNWNEAIHVDNEYMLTISYVRTYVMLSPLCTYNRHLFRIYSYVFILMLLPAGPRRSQIPCENNTLWIGWHHKVTSRSRRRWLWTLTPCASHREGECNKRKERREKS